MKKKVIVLGAGLVGKAMALDLAKDFEVTAADIDHEVLREITKSGIQPLTLDFTDTSKLKEAIQPFDLVVGAVPGFLGFQTAQSVIGSGKSMVDISFFEEDPFALDELALQNKVTLITDCGVAPGMSNVILGFHNETMQVHSFECLVGGLPVAREWPYQYKTVFSPVDVIEEYVRPARFIQNHNLVVKEALSDPKIIEFKEVGPLESFNSDGLRTLLRTMSHIPNMIEKTLRYPGSIEYIRALRESGFFSHESIDIRGIGIRPIDVTSKLLFSQWKLKPGEEEFTIMRIRLEGKENGLPKTYQYDLLDRTDKATGILSMARTTGYVCTAAAHLVLNGLYSVPGISPPEFLGKHPAHFNFIKKYLEARGVKYHLTTTN